MLTKNACSSIYETNKFKLTGKLMFEVNFYTLMQIEIVSNVSPEPALN